jgi:hypothetical protein
MGHLQHARQVGAAEAELSRIRGLQVCREVLDDFRAPALRFLSVGDDFSDAPVHGDHRGVGGALGADEMKAMLPEPRALNRIVDETIAKHAAEAD